MDARRFDQLAQDLSAAGTRRRLLRQLTALPLAGVLVVILGPETAGADGSGAIIRHPKRREPRDPCQNKKCGPCKRCKNGECKRKPNGTPCRGNRVCKGGTCRRRQPTCPALGLTCTTPAGTPCCPDIDPGVVCAGGQSSDRICQDCTKAPTAAGAFCQATSGNQCCGGSPTCFVGVRVEDNQPACYSTGICQSPGDPCTTDAECGGSLECAVGSALCGCGGATPTFCGTPCA